MINEDGDRLCNLECVAGPKVREFVGPVKIVLVEPTPADYSRRVWATAFIHLANLLIAATVVTVLYTTMIFQLPFISNLHIALCVVAFHLWLPSGILMLNPLFGGATVLRPAHRRSQHIFLQVATLIGGNVGAACLFTELKMNIHTLTGAFSVLGISTNGALGLIVYCFPCSEIAEKFGYLHRLIGITTFVMSSICLISGVLAPNFGMLCGLLRLRELPYVLIVFNLVYTTIMILSLYWKERND